MINVVCGWESQRRLIKREGCGVWVGYGGSRLCGYSPATPHFHKGIAYCVTCIKGFDVVHLDEGLCVRPREESDDVPAPAGPGLEGLYS